MVLALVVAFVFFEAPRARASEVPNPDEAYQQQQTVVPDPAGNGARSAGKVSSYVTKTELPTSPVAYPFLRDPLGLTAHANLVTLPPLWKVFTCDIGTGYYLPSPTFALENWGPEVAEWFVWASGGSYIPVFEPVPTPLTASNRTACTNAAVSKLTAAERFNGTAVLVLVNAFPVDGGALGYGLGRFFTYDWEGSALVAVPDTGFTPYVNVGGGGIDTGRAGLIVHEMGHAIGWHHTGYRHSSNPYSFPGDVMSTMTTRPPAHVFNRYRAGWVDRSRVAFHTAPAQEVTLTLPHGDGPEMLVIADPNVTGRLYAVGVTAGLSFTSQDPTPSGVDIFYVDQSAGSPYRRSYHRFCPSLDKTRHSDDAMCAFIGSQTDAVAPSHVPDFELYNYTPGTSVTVGGVKITPLSYTSTGVRIALSGTPTPFWPRDYQLIPAEGQFTDVGADHLFFTEINRLYSLDLTRGCAPDRRQFCPGRSVTRGEMAAFLVRMGEIPSGAGEARFIDTAGHLFRTEIEALAGAGITRGCNPPANDRFCPDRYITRGEVAIFLDRFLELPTAPLAFGDTAETIYGPATSALAAVGITKGCNPPANDRFCPDRYITRGEMATFLVRAYGRYTTP